MLIALSVIIPFTMRIPMYINYYTYFKGHKRTLVSLIEPCICAPIFISEPNDLCGATLEHASHEQEILI